MVTNESMTELAQNIVRVQIANSIYFFLCDKSEFLRSVDIMNEADANSKKAGRNKREENSEETLNKSPLML